MARGDQTAIIPTLRAGASHVCNVHDTVYTAWANHEFQTGAPVVTFY